MATQDPLDALAAQVRDFERGEEFQREQHIAQVLTRAFIPAGLPAVPGHELGLVYRPADGEPAGGDLYGAWELPGSRVGVLVGDVTGKGLETAATSAMARFFIEAFTWEAASAGEALARADAVLQHRLPPDTFVTAFLGILGPDRLLFANAGHMLPLLVRAGGEVEPVVAGGVPLGVGEATGWDDHEIALGPGDLLLAYTDGLVEARHEGELFGAERLYRAIAAAVALDDDLNTLVEEVHDSVRDWAGMLTDDAVVLAVRRNAA